MKSQTEFYEGQKTLKLAEVIPIENIKIYFHLFQDVKAFLQSLDKKDLGNYSSKKISQILYKVQKSLSGYGEEMQISAMQQILQNITDNKDHLKMIFYRVLKRVGRPGDRALGLLVNMLVYDSMKYSLKKIIPLLRTISLSRI